MARRHVVVIGAAAVSVTCGARHPPPRRPAMPAPPPAFCAPAAIVDRVALRCMGSRMTDESQLSISQRDARGWHELREDASKTYTPESFTPFESEMMDRQLSSGLQSVCAGIWKPEVGWRSLHRPELGWPMFRCLSYALVLFIGDQRYELERPGGYAFRWVASNLQGHWLGLVDVPSCGSDQVEQDGLCVDSSGRLP